MIPQGWTAARTIAATHSGEISCTELITSVLEKTEQTHRLTGGVVEVHAETALLRAAELDAMSLRERNALPLFGLPYGYKDVFSRHGRSPGVGQPVSRPKLHAMDAHALVRADGAGAIAVARLNMDPLGYSATGLNEHLGDTRNPWDTNRICGGSSSGAAAAVASGLLPVAIASDTGGSIRIPAALCGVVGLKPTYGRISRRGVAPVSYSQDTVGVIARTARDVAAVLEVLAGYDPADPGSIDAPPVPPVGTVESLSGLRIGIDEAYLLRSATAEVSDAVRSAVGELLALGSEAASIDLRAFADFDTAATVLTWTEVNAAYGPNYREHRSRYATAVRSRLDSAMMAPASAHVDAQRLQGRALRDTLTGPFAQCDVIIMPTTAATAPLISTLHGGQRQAAAVNAQLLTLNRPINFLGLPSLSVPVGFGANGMPIGMQLIGRPWCESVLLRTAAAYQSVTSWHTQSPSTISRS